jgi:hypothetical protein
VTIADALWLCVGFLFGFVAARWLHRRRRRRGLLMIPPTRGPIR